MLIDKTTTCKKCEFFHEGMDYSLDGWDRGSDWSCKKINRMIESFVEVRKPLIPHWCPCGHYATQQLFFRKEKIEKLLKR